MSTIKNIKKRLSMSTTMPAGTAGVPWLPGTTHPHHHHEHNADGSCCGHDHDNKHHHHDHDEDCDEDHTNPSGGCC